MDEIVEGTVVITGTHQAGTFVGIEAGQACVLLANTCLWYGNPKEMRIPQDQADLDSTFKEVDRFEGR